jgi:hypothetical protein
VVAGTGIPTAVLAEQFKAGDPVPELAKEYGASEEAVWDAIRCELELTQGRLSRSSFFSISRRAARPSLRRCATPAP